MEFTAALLYKGILSHYLISSGDNLNFIARLLNVAAKTDLDLPLVINLKKNGRWQSDCDEEITRDLGSHIDMKMKDEQRNQENF